MALDIISGGSHDGDETGLASSHHAGRVVKSRIEHFGYKVPGFAQHLRMWGKAGVVKSKKVNKVHNYGTTCIFIGYVNHHSVTCYRMWDPEMGGVSGQTNWTRQSY